MKLTTKKIIFSFVLLLLFVPAVASAADDYGLVGCSGLDECNFCGFLKMLKGILNWMFQFAYLGGALVIIVGGGYMLVAGAADGITRGRKMIVTSVIGIVIVSVAWLAVNLVIYMIVPEGARTSDNTLLSWFDINCTEIDEFLTGELVDTSDESQINNSNSLNNIVGVEVYGCTDPTAINYDDAATMDNGGCLYSSAVVGCMDQDALNFDPLATKSDPSLCEYPEGVITGCNDPTATNYNSAAEKNDGSCQYENENPGCTDPEASNYDPSATVDDNSCSYEELGSGDLCVDGSVGNSGSPNDNQARLEKKVLSQAHAQGVTDQRQIAYIMATIAHETNWRIRSEDGCSEDPPCTENGCYNSKSYGECDPDTGRRYFGRGFVQLTHDYNYEKYSKILKDAGFINWDIYNNPEYMNQDEDMAIYVTIYGMKNGEFTGVGLDKYINEDEENYYGARAIINGDKKKNGTKIANEAKEYLNC